MFRLRIIKSLISLANLFLGLFAAIVYKKQTRPESILLFRTGSIGDTVCAIPSIVAIRKKFPNAKLTILTNSGGSKLVGMKNILDPTVYDELIDYYGLSGKQLIRTLRQKHFDLFIQLPQTDAGFWRLFRDLLFFRTIASSGWGWEYSTFPYFRQMQERYNRFPNETDRLLAILKKNGIEPDTRDYRLQLKDPNDLNVVDNAFREEGLHNAGFLLAIVVGAKRPQNRWPIAYFREVMEHFQDSCQMILIGGPEDRSLTQSLQGISHVTDFTGRFTPMQSAIALQRCQLTLSNDTGPMHLSYASGTPTLGLFSSRDFPGKWAPPAGNANGWFRASNIPCSLCLSEDCKNNICMQAILPQDVIEKIETFLIARKATESTF